MKCRNWSARPFYPCRHDGRKRISVLHARQSGEIWSARHDQKPKMTTKPGYGTAHSQRRGCRCAHHLPGGMKSNRLAQTYIPVSDGSRRTRRLCACREAGKSKDRGQTLPSPSTMFHCGSSRTFRLASPYADHLPCGSRCRRFPAAISSRVRHGRPRTSFLHERRAAEIWSLSGQIGHFSRRFPSGMRRNLGRCGPYASHPSGDRKNSSLKAWEPSKMSYGNRRKRSPHALREGRSRFLPRG